MSNIKKIIGVVLALVMVLSVATVAFAAPEDNYSITFTADKTTLSEGETATVEVKVTTNFKVSAMTIPVFFDNTKVAVTAAPAATDQAELERTTIASVDSEEYNDLSRFYRGTTYTEADHGVVALNYLPVTGDAIRQYNNETVMTLTVTALTGASGTAVIECLSTTVKTNANPGGTLLIAKNKSGAAVVDSEGEIIDNGVVAGAKTTITIAGGAASTPELLLSEYGKSVGAVISRDHCTGDTDSEGNAFAGCVMGIDTIGTYSMDAILDCLTTPAGSITVNTDESQGNETTGAIIELRDDNGEIVERYVFIYFGDLDRDGMIATSDGTIIMDYEFTLDGLNTEYELLAADIDGDDMVSANDGTILIDFEFTLDAAASFYPSQAEIAAKYA